MLVAIYSQKYKTAYREVLFSVFKHFLPTDVIYIEANLWKDFSEKEHFNFEVITFSSIEDLNQTVDVMLTIGGDGTILRAMNYIQHLEIPILGINAGRLGFLATISQDEITYMFEQLRKKEYKIIPRSVLQVFEKEKSSAEKEIFALNEVTVIRKNTTSMITVETKLNEEYLTSYWADGLIIATPTGSTGYSLSCGGPVVMPSASNLILTPIAPHNLNARPLIIPDDIEVSLKVSSRENSYFVSFDAHLKSLPCNTEIIVKKAPFFLKMIELEAHNFTKTLRDKLLWGEDKRN